MSDKKIKVKDLATELNLASKDLLTAAKDLQINAAKVATSSLSSEEAEKLRNHFSPNSQEKPEVIVRRRSTPSRSSQSSASQESTKKPEPEKKEGEGLKVKEEKMPSVAKKVQTEAPQEKIVSTDAKIISPPQQSPEKAAKVESKKVEAAELVEAASPAKKVETLEKAEKAETKIANEEKASSGAKIIEKPASPSANARIIRPASFSAEPEKNAHGETVSSTPLLSPRVDEESKEGHGDQKAHEKSSPEAFPSSGGVRVISRPSPTQAPTQRRDETSFSRDGAGQKPREGTGQRPRGNFTPRPGDDRRPMDRDRNDRGTPAGRDDRSRDAGRDDRNRDAGRERTFSRTPAPAPLNTPFAPAEEQGRKKRQKGRRTVEFERNSYDSENAAIMRTSSSKRKNKHKGKDLAASGNTQPMRAIKKVIKVEEFIRVSDLAHQMGLKAGEIIKILFSLGVMATINQSLDIDTTTLVAAEFGYEVERVGFFEEDVLAQLRTEAADTSLLKTRPPVVTIMGHVDHGKTSLLDALRKTTTASGEAGGITQHIGAYHVKTPKGEIVFLDTPGHEAFTAMRARGAEVTDIVVLVVAADDGVMEQTREAVSHAKVANVPIMVAVNKMDKEEANPERVKRELADLGLIPEEWGGTTTFSYVSAKTGDGLDELLELLALQAEILELKANPSAPATGHIVEAKLDKGRGALGTVLITNGTLRQGDAFVCGVHSGRVRAMFNDQGKKVKEAGPSIPVEVQGFEGVPEAGDEFIGLEDEKMARRIAETRALKHRERALARESKVTLETFLAKKASDVEAVVLNLVVKADVQGSLEAIVDAVAKLSTEKVRINVIHGGTGAISESDILLASASNGIIIGFNVRPTAKAKELSENEKIDIRYYDIIYKLVEEIKSAMEGMLAPVEKEVYLGTLNIRETFSVPKIGLIAGCFVADGKIVRTAQVRLLRDGIVIYTGKISSLRRFKDDVREVAKGYECGVGLENYNDLKVGDAIEAFEVVEEKATL